MRRYREREGLANVARISGLGPYTCVSRRNQPSLMSSDRVPTLTKKDVARRVAALRDEPLYRAEPWVSAVFDALRELMVEADPEVRLEIRDFGVFEVKRTKAKPKARNPRTNETVFIPSRRKTHFKPSKLLREALQRPLSELGYELPAGAADAEPTPKLNGHVKD